MRSVRRIAAPALVGALALGSMVLGASPSHGSEGAIFVIGGSGFQVSGLTGVAMTDAEELQIQPLVGSLGSYVVRIYDGLEDDLGRPILRGGAGCLPSSGATAQLVCTFVAPPSEVIVNFSALHGDTNVSLMEGAALSLTFIGGSGRDYVQGGTGNDTMQGNGGNDRLYGGPGNDLLEGGPGDDYLEGESGSDDMRGGSGSNSIDAADNLADVRVDCGGVPTFLDFDKDLDLPTNCGANPTPIPPAPVEPIDPPAPGKGDGTVDGAPVDVEVEPKAPDDTTSVRINTGPSNPIFQSQLLWIGTPSTPPVPTFPPFPAFDMSISPLWPGSIFDVSIFPPAPVGPVSAHEKSARAGALETVSLQADADGVARGKIPVPAGRAPGDYTLQLNGVTAAGAQMTVNVGVRLDTATPEPDPEPDESITISAKRGAGKQAATITVSGTTTGLAGTAVTPRYRVQGAKKWSLGKPVTVMANGSFTGTLVTRKKVRIVMVSGAIKSQPVQVAAVRR